MELMKSVAIQQMQNDARNNGSGLANQAMNLLSQQQAQKAREQEMMQKFLMQRQMRKEDFERQVEFGKMFKKENKESKDNKEYIQMSKDVAKTLEPLEKEKNSSMMMKNLVDKTEDPSMVSTLDKLQILKKIGSEPTNRLMGFLNGTSQEAKKVGNDLDAIINQVKNIVLLEAKRLPTGANWTSEDSENISELMNDVKGSAIAYISKTGAKPSVNAVKTILASKGLTLLEGGQSVNNFYRKMYDEEQKDINRKYQEKKKILSNRYVGQDFESFMENEGRDQQFAVDQKYNNQTIVSEQSFRDKIQQLGTKYQIPNKEMNALISQYADDEISLSNLYKNIENSLIEGQQLQDALQNPNVVE
jgi:hypothetical protein